MKMVFSERQQSRAARRPPPSFVAGHGPLEPCAARLDLPPPSPLQEPEPVPISPLSALCPDREPPSKIPPPLSLSREPRHRGAPHVPYPPPPPLVYPEHRPVPLLDKIGRAATASAQPCHFLVALSSKKVPADKALPGVCSVGWWYFTHKPRRWVAIGACATMRRECVVTTHGALCYVGQHGPMQPRGRANVADRLAV
jgi:hypothetical protein